ncbi:MAG: transposase, partial [Rhodospirillales bacterium]|nr:transposase [Rhodospirillales bacterium]
LKTGEMLIVAASRIRIKTALPIYRNRWGIETLFSALKTRGLRLENTHMTSPHKLATLMSVLAITFCLAYKTGLWVARIKPPRQKPHGRLQRSLFALGLNTFRKAMVEMSELEIHDYMTAPFKPNIPRKTLIRLVL